MVLHSAGESVIYPAHAGINRSLTAILRILANLPRTRGDKPLPSDKIKALEASTPHTRG